MATDTRQKILDAATRLFAAADSRGASLRAVARAAGVNSALVHYHFGSRESLFEAAILAALTPIQERRRTLLDALRASRPIPDARDLARLFVEPLLPDAKVERERHAMALRLLSRFFSEQRPLIQDLTLKHFGDLMYALGDYLGEALVEIPVATRHRRMQFSVEAALETLAGQATASLSRREPLPSLDDDVVSDLIDFLAGGLSAAVS